MTSFSSSGSTGGRPRGSVLAKGPFVGDQDSKPTQQGVGSDEGDDLSKATPSDALGFASKPDSLGVSEASGSAAELFEENPVLFLQVFDDELLVSIHPAGDGDE